LSDPSETIEPVFGTKFGGDDDATVLAAIEGWAAAEASAAPGRSGRHTRPT
jgi:hypothetical protein